MKGKQNGDLLREAEQAGYHVLLTVDYSIAHQHNFTERKLCVIAIRARTNQLEDLLPLAAQVAAALESIAPGQIVLVG